MLMRYEKRRKGDGYRYIYFLNHNKLIASHLPYTEGDKNS